MRHWIGKLVQISIYNISNAFNNRLSTRRALFEHCTTSSNIDEYILLTYLLNIDLSSSSSQFWAELCQAAAAITNTASSLPAVDLGQARPTTPRPLHRAPPPAPASQHQTLSNSVHYVTRTIWTLCQNKKFKCRQQQLLLALQKHIWLCLCWFVLCIKTSAIALNTRYLLSAI